MNPQNSGYIRADQSPGPPARNSKGNPERKNGRVISLWSYADLAIESVSAKNGAARGELDKSGLTLEPVIVSHYFRRHGDKIIFVDGYSSHRWKFPEKAGEIRTL